MTCYFVKDRNGKHLGIICGRLGPHCDCGGVASKLCDFPVGRGKTCDRKLCEHCSQQLSPDIDYCQAHYREWRAFREAGGVQAELESVIPFKGR